MADHPLVSLYVNDAVVISLAHVVLCTWSNTQHVDETTHELKIFLEGGNKANLLKPEAVDFVRVLALFHETRSAQK